MLYYGNWLSALVAHENVNHVECWELLCVPTMWAGDTQEVASTIRQSLRGLGRFFYLRAEEWPHRIFRTAAQQHSERPHYRCHSSGNG